MINFIKEFYYPITEDEEEDDNIDQELEGGDMGAEEDGMMDDMDMEGDQEIDDFPNDDMDQENEVEVDVTDIVQKQDDILSKIDTMEASMEGDDLVDQKINMLSSKIDSNNSQIEVFIKKLEDTIKRRLPNETEKLQMRSLNSFPFNQSLTYFWYGDKKIVKSEDEEDTYELRTSDVQNYDAIKIEKSL